MIWYDGNGSYSILGNLLICLMVARTNNQCITSQISPRWICFLNFHIYVFIYFCAATQYLGPSYPQRFIVSWLISFQLRQRLEQMFCRLLRFLALAPSLVWKNDIRAKIGWGNRQIQRACMTMTTTRLLQMQKQSRADEVYLGRGDIYIYIYLYSQTPLFGEVSS